MAKKRRTSHKVVSVHRPKRTITKHRRKRSGLSAAKMSSAKLMPVLKASAGGAVGGYAASLINPMLPAKFGSLGRIGIGVGIGAVTNMFLNSPNVASGIVGAMVALNNIKTNLSEEELAEYAGYDSLSEEPMYLSEEGIELTMDEDGNYYYSGE